MSDFAEKYMRNIAQREHAVKSQNTYDLGASMPIDNRIPMRLNMSIASAQEALRYWLSHVVFRERVEIAEVTFSEKEHFLIKLDRSAIAEE